MPRALNLEIANFICKFGADINMLDRFNEVVKPAFLSDFERVYRDTTYLFIDVSIEFLEVGDPNSAAIVGRLVKDTVLKREQVFDRHSRGLVTDRRKLNTAPSSIFALLLASHRLLYVREQSDSPTFAAFRTTCERFLRKSHLRYISSTRAELKSMKKTVTKKSLLEATPIPSVEVVPIVSQETIDDFVRRFKILRSAKFTVLLTNNENDDSSFILEELRRMGEEVRSHKSTVEYRNANGLNKKEIKQQMVAARQGNTAFSLQGIDDHGSNLNGDNQHFNIRHPLHDVPATVIDAGRMMFRNCKDGVIKLVSVSQDVRGYIRELMKGD